MKFLADCMLGKLARWLRILGYDTAYDNHAEDDDLLAAAERENRILLTRDRPLFERARSIPCVFVEKNQLDHQIAQLVTEVGLDLDRETFTRCLECNVPILDADLEQVRMSVPPFVLKSRTRFYRCPECLRVYWSGSHTDRMEARLSAIREAVQQSPETISNG